jgi:hypothetical protein
MKKLRWEALSARLQRLVDEEILERRLPGGSAEAEAEALTTAV